MIQDTRPFDDVGCTCFDCNRPGTGEKIETKDVILPSPVAHNRTPWAVECLEHGLVHLSSHEYRRQLCKANNKWVCPVCWKISAWSDDEYELYEAGVESGHK